MSKVIKGILVVLLLVYVVSPLDLCPGPIDDIILVLCAIGGNALYSARNNSQ